MDRTDTAGRHPLRHGTAFRTYVELVTMRRGHPPIYAQLVAEWQARGRVAPGPRDLPWASVAAPAAGKGPEWSATSWAVGRYAQALPAVGVEPAEQRRPAEASAPVPAVVVPRGVPVM